MFDNFIQFLYISYLLKGTGKYGIYYNGFMWRVLFQELQVMAFFSLPFFFQTVREKIGAIATPDYIQNAPSLPKTRSGINIGLFIIKALMFMMLKCSSVFFFLCFFREDHASCLAEDSM